MFDRIKKAFSRDAIDRAETPGPVSQMAHGPVSEWATTKGFGFAVDGTGHGVSLDGKVRGKPWRLQVGKPSRDYIRGEELRARADLGIDEDVAVLVMNRTLKEALEKRAYRMYTDTLQTQSDPSLPEEMRWLAMNDEVGWDSLPKPFWDRYAILTDNRAKAMAWVEPGLAAMMTDWPHPAPTAEVPMLFLLLRGKAYLRMEYSSTDMPTLQHASAVFTRLCESALNALPATRPAR